MATKKWVQATTNWDDISATGVTEYDFAEFGPGVVLLRTIISVYVAAIGFIDPDPIAPLVPAPTAYVLVETNSSVNPFPPVIDPWGIDGTGHTLAGRIINQRWDGAVNRFETSGTSHLASFGTTDYTFTHVDKTTTLITGYDHDDTHAQRFFPSGDPTFVITCKPGFFGARASGGNYYACATMKHLFQVP